MISQFPFHNWSYKLKVNNKLQTKEVFIMFVASKNDNCLKQFQSLLGQYHLMQFDLIRSIICGEVGRSFASSEDLGFLIILNTFLIISFLYEEFKKKKVLKHLPCEAISHLVLRNVLLIT